MLEHVQTRDQIANVFIKALNVVQFKALRVALGLCTINCYADLNNIQDSVDMPSDQILDEFVESMVMSSCLDTVSVNPLIHTSVLRIDNLFDEGSSRDDLIGLNTELSYIRPSIAPFVIPEADDLEVGSLKVAQCVVRDVPAIDKDKSENFVKDDVVDHYSEDEESSNDNVPLEELISKKKKCGKEIVVSKS
ncbi:unnamed protein product [Citrullus colocynthis]|uniref:Uncharacterized protein n=1 Tax=Citrullus colocynthis TaxID=252529 RepID=A0ABP0YIW3_9ROSI